MLRLLTCAVYRRLHGDRVEQGEREMEDEGAPPPPEPMPSPPQEPSEPQQPTDDEPTIFPVPIDILKPEFWGRLLEGTPTVLIEDGDFVVPHLRREGSSGDARA